MIFTLHHVRPEPEEPRAYAPNRILEVTPDFLDTVLDQVQEVGLDVLSLDADLQRLKENDDRRFVCFTFDDGYRDNLEYAYPLFKRRDLPFALYVPTDYPEGTANYGGSHWRRPSAAPPKSSFAAMARCGVFRPPPRRKKTRAFDEIYWWLRLIDEAAQRRVVRGLADRYEVDMAEECARLVMGWDELRTLAADALVTIGAHTKGHFAISKVSEQRALEEMRGSADCIEKELGTRPKHFSFPYGDPGSAGPRDFQLAPGRLQDGCDHAQRNAVPGAPASPHRTAARVAERRISVAHLYRALFVRRAVCSVESLPAGGRRLSLSRGAASSGSGAPPVSPRQVPPQGRMRIVPKPARA
jgi:peptidoglycan/xylan/chitin deacetylase (PgdA/CDA1 family)